MLFYYVSSAALLYVFARLPQPKVVPSLLPKVLKNCIPNYSSNAELIDPFVFIFELQTNSSFFFKFIVQNMASDIYRLPSNRHIFPDCIEAMKCQRYSANFIAATQNLNDILSQSLRLYCHLNGDSALFLLTEVGSSLAKLMATAKECFEVDESVL